VTHKEDECLLTGGSSLHGMVPETHADEDDGKDGESHELDISIGIGKQGGMEHTWIGFLPQLSMKAKVK
jgi:hypothetical protein